ncbi:MAG: sigma-70 family RNA polymerase sigma factor [Flavobacteriaceae bacterium]|nr:sigma-70 family RNA polymerase sigma factor [Flavobacteriaceae bacterium]MDG2315077.1 sigma-70 family RNA polymerase sigma factor [Flavobacteriaceae bacterium]
MAHSTKDADLIVSYIQGNEHAFEILLTRYKQRVYSFIFSKVMNRDITEDVFQDTFIKVIQTIKKGKYNEEGKFLPWVLRIAHNLVIDHFRKNKRFPKFENRDDYDIFSHISEPEKDIESFIIDKQIESVLSDLIAELPQDQADVLLMRLYKGMNFKDIAELTNVSINTALGRMRYALINIRKMVVDKNISLTQ